TTMIATITRKVPSERQLITAPRKLKLDSGKSDGNWWLLFPHSQAQIPVTRVRMPAVVATIGILTLVTGICAWLWGYNNHQFPSLFPLSSFNFLGAVISWRSLGTFLVIVAIMVVLQLLFMKTKLGLALRAVATNPESSAFSGLPVGRLLMVGWGLAASLGAVAGTLVAPQLTLTPGMLDTALIYALAAVILGGLTSPVGAVVGAWLIGILENLAAVYVSFIGYDLKVAVPFILILVILIFRPQGLLGRKVVARV